MSASNVGEHAGLAEDAKQSEAAPAAGTEFLSLHTADWLGFDLDLTFVRYRLDSLSRLIFECLCTYFVEHKGYNPEILTRGYLEHFPTRGLVYDMKLGNFLLLTATGKVVKAFHGTRILEASQVEMIYPSGLPNVADILKTQTNLKVEGFHVFATFFDMPSIPLVANFVDLEDSMPTPMYGRILADFVGAFTYCFDPSNFAMNKGGFFPKVKANPGEYILKISPRMLSWIMHMREIGVRLFLLTNSQADYTNLLLTYACGEDWRDLFDLVIVNGCKPDFFTKPSSPFRAVGSDLTIGDPTALALGNLVAGGNHKDLAVFMRTHTKRGMGPEDKMVVVYFGDQPWTDTAAVSQSTDWHAVAVLEEMLHNRPPVGEGECPVRQADKAAALHMGPAIDHWGAFFPATLRDEHLLVEQLLVDHCSLVVPHLDAVAARPFSHAFSLVTPSEPRGGVHHHA